VQFSELYARPLKHLGLKASSTALLAERKEWVNDACREIISAYDWRSKFGRDIVQTEAQESGSTLQAASAGDTALTINDANWDTGWTKRKIKIGVEIYEVTSFGSTTTATLADGLIADVAAGASYEVYRDEYSAPSDCDKIRTIFPATETYAQLMRLDILTMSSLKSGDQAIRDYPRSWAESGRDSSGNIEFLIHPIPSTLFNLHIWYEKAFSDMTADADRPDLIPEAQHHLINLKTKEMAFDYRGKDNRASKAAREYETALHRAILREEVVPGMVKLDGAIFRGAARDWEERLIARESVRSTVPSSVALREIGKRGSSPGRVCDEMEGGAAVSEHD
jgi:hypothetical protein